jgi:hypothetical protein
MLLMSRWKMEGAEVDLVSFAGSMLFEAETRI